MERGQGSSTYVFWGGPGRNSWRGGKTCGGTQNNVFKSLHFQPWYPRFNSIKINTLNKSDIFTGYYFHCVKISKVLFSLCEHIKCYFHTVKITRGCDITSCIACSVQDFTPHKLYPTCIANHTKCISHENNCSSGKCIGKCIKIIFFVKFSFFPKIIIYNYL